MSSVQLFLHIGTNKTGTTSIQSFMSVNRGTLKKNSIFYPVSAGRQNHLKLGASCLNDDKIDNVRRGLGLNSSLTIAEYRHKFATELQQEAGGWPSDATIVFSNEHMLRLVQPEEKRRLHNIMKQISQQIKVIIYLRRQDSFFASEYSQKLKAGQTGTFDPQGPVKRSVYDYLQIVDSWAAEFGLDNIIVRPFEKAQFVNGDLIDDFVHLIGGSHVAGLLPIEQKNSSFDAHTAEFVRLLNDQVSNMHGPKSKAERDGIIKVIEAISTGPRIGLTDTEAQEFYARFEDGNARVAMKYLGRLDGKLFFDSPGGSGGIKPVLSAEQAVKIAFELVRHRSNRDERRKSSTPRDGSAASRKSTRLKVAGALASEHG